MLQPVHVGHAIDPIAVMGSCWDEQSGLVVVAKRARADASPVSQFLDGERSALWNCRSCSDLVAS